MDLITEGTDLLIKNQPVDLQADVVRQALGDLFDTINPGDLRQALRQNRQLQHRTSAWLGAEHDRWFAINQVESILGPERVDVFAARLGLDKRAAAAALADILPLLTRKPVESSKPRTP